MPVRQLSPIAQRRPGHAVMARLLDELDRRDLADVPADLLSWSTGAWGEIVAGHELARLPEGWHVLHSIPVGRVADIDHLVIGPGGVFVLNTKRHPGKRVRVGTHVVWIEGTEVIGYQRDLLARCADVRGRLGTETVEPLLVFVDTVETSSTGPQPVPGVALEGLLDHLLAAPVVLGADRITTVLARATQPDTWGRSTRSLHEPDPTGRFVALGRAAPAIAPAPPVPERSRPPVLRLFLAGVALPALALVGASWALSVVAQLVAP